MTDLPRRAVTRTAKLATLPLGFAGRTAIGFGKRIGGKPAELVAMEIQQRTAEQIFKVLGQLKGGAMKVGQALSVLEAALPEEIAGPYRATLTRLQDSAPPLPATTVHRVLAESLGDEWRSNFLEFSDKPAAAASIGQVHKAVWEDGREVAVKIQYPGAGKALMSDFNQIARLGKMFAALFPGLEIKPLIDELRERLAEELDYIQEAENQRAFAKEFLDDPLFCVPDVVAANENILVTEWIDGTPLSKIIAGDDQPSRDRAGMLYADFLLSSPGRVGLMHGDPHPGNFRILADGRMGVIDFGAVARLPGGIPRSFGTILRLTMEDDIHGAMDVLRDEGFIRAGVEVDPRGLQAFLAPFTEGAQVEVFKFTRERMREEFGRIVDFRPNNVVRQLNLPASWVLFHRSSGAMVAVLCQLESEGRFQNLCIRALPGFTDDELRAATIADYLANRAPSAFIPFEDPEPLPAPVKGKKRASKKKAPPARIAAAEES